MNSPFNIQFICTSITMLVTMVVEARKATPTLNPDIGFVLYRTLCKLTYELAAAFNINPGEKILAHVSHARNLDKKDDGTGE